MQVIQKADQKHLNKAGWQALSNEWESSGLRQAEFCQSKGLKFHTFSYWRLRLKKTSKPKPSFQAVNIKQPDNKSSLKPSVQLRLPNGINVVIPLEADKRLLKAIFELLGINGC